MRDYRADWTSPESKDIYDHPMTFVSSDDLKKE